MDSNTEIKTVISDRLKDFAIKARGKAVSSITEARKNFRETQEALAEEKKAEAKTGQKGKSAGVELGRQELMRDAPEETFRVSIPRPIHKKGEEVYLKKVRVLKNGFTVEDAFRELIGKRERGYSITNIDLLLYPYLLIDYSVDMGQRLSRLNENIMCLVDLFRGDFSLAKSRGTYFTYEAQRDILVPIRVDRKKAIKEAPRNIYGEIMAKQRILKIPDINYEKDQYIYKPFYVVECRNSDGEYFHVLFDAVSGDFSLLNA